MTLYRHHEGQMTTYELTMGQIQTAEKHLRAARRAARRAGRATSRGGTSS